MKDKYLYPAVFEYAHDGINVSFPDLPGTFTCGDTTEEALEMAKEAMELYLYTLEVDGKKIPKPSDLIKAKENQRVILIDAYMPTVRMEMGTKAVKKTLTLPSWVNDAAEKAGINFSQTLQAALLTQLGMTSIAIPHKKKSKIS